MCNSPNGKIPAVMRTFLKDKRVILFVALLAIVALVALGSLLKDVTFSPPHPLSQSESQTIKISVSEVVERIAEVPIWKQVVFWILLFFIILLISSLLSPEMRKRLLLGFLRMALFTFVLIYIVQKNPGFLEGILPQNLFGNGPSEQNPFKDIPAPVFEPPQISGWLSFLITFGIVLLFALVVWRVNRWWVRQNELLALRRPLEELAEITRDSLRDLSLRNASYHDTIIQCYERMSRAVGVKRGLSREISMTPSEFVTRLEKAGLPHESVNRLTQLFETVRYGSQISEQREVDEAISCLTTILKYCGETV
jgi:hypothetical protein